MHFSSVDVRGAALTHRIMWARMHTVSSLYGFSVFFSNVMGTKCVRISLAMRLLSVS